MRRKNRLGILAAIYIPSTTIIDKSDYYQKYYHRFAPHVLNSGSKPTKHRLKVKLSRKANVQRLMKNK